MKRRFCYRFTVVLVACVCMLGSAQAAFSVSSGTLFTVPLIDLTLVLSEDMSPADGGDICQYGYVGKDMFIGLSLLPYTDFDKLRDERIGGFAKESQLKIKGFDARQYTPVEAGEIDAIYEIQASANSNILEITFVPSDTKEKDTNQAIIEQVLRSLHSRSQTYEADADAAGWQILFNHSDVGLQCILPSSMVKRANPASEDSVVEYQNDYVILLIFAYQATVDEYVASYDMNTNDFYRPDIVVNGVNVHVFEPKSSDISTDSAYVVAEGKNGVLLEMVFGTEDASEEEQNWRYINQIIANISAM